MLRIMSLRNCKLKQQGDATIHRLEWLKPKTLTTPVAAKMWSNRKSLPSLLGECKMVQPFRRQFGGFLHNEAYSCHMTQQ